MVSLRPGTSGPVPRPSLVPAVPSVGTCVGIPLSRLSPVLVVPASVPALLVLLSWLSVFSLVAPCVDITPVD